MMNIDGKNSNIIHLLKTKAHNTVFAATAQVEGYWDGLCNGMTLPSRREIDPRALESALEYSFVLERIAPGICRFRIAGRHLNDLMGMEVRGMPISAMFLPEARKELGVTLENICAEPCIKEVYLTAGRSLGRGELKGKLFLAPLLDDEGQVTRILGCLQTNGKIGRQPRRFSISEITTKELFMADPGPVIRANNRKHAFAEAPHEYTPTPSVQLPVQNKTSGKNKPALQLVINND